jgi:hypothetical protein
MGKCRETGILLLGEETKPQKSKQVNKQKWVGDYGHHQHLEMYMYIIILIGWEMFDRSLCFFLRWAGHQVIEETTTKIKN